MGLNERDFYSQRVCDGGKKSTNQEQKQTSEPAAKKRTGKKKRNRWKWVEGLEHSEIIFLVEVIHKGKQ